MRREWLLSICEQEPCHEMEGGKEGRREGEQEFRVLRGCGKFIKMQGRLI